MYLETKGRAWKIKRRFRKKICNITCLEKDRNIDTQARMVENLHEQPSRGVFTPVPDLSPTPSCRVRRKRKGRNNEEELVTNAKTNFVGKIRL